MLQTSRLTCIVCIITNSHLALSKCLVDTKATHDVKAVLASQLSSQVTLSLMDRILKSCSTCHWHSIGKQKTMTERETHCNWPSLQLTLTASGSPLIPLLPHVQQHDVLPADQWSQPASSLWRWAIPTKGSPKVTWPQCFQICRILNNVCWKLQTECLDWFLPLSPFFSNIDLGWWMMCCQCHHRGQAMRTGKTCFCSVRGRDRGVTTLMIGPHGQRFRSQSFHRLGSWIQGRHQDHKHQWHQCLWHQGRHH